MRQNVHGRGAERSSQSARADAGRAPPAMLRTVIRPGDQARRDRGPDRGPTHQIIPAPPVPSVRYPVSSVQLARMVHGAVVLIIRRSWVRAPPAPPAVSMSDRVMAV